MYLINQLLVLLEQKWILWNVFLMIIIGHLSKNIFNFSRREQADFCACEAQKCEEVQRSIEKHREIQTSTE